MPSTSGPRPVATSIRSASTFSPSPKWTTSPEPVSSTFLHVESRWSAIPRFENCFFSSACASASSAGIRFGSISMIVTSEPNRLKIDANSQPMIPPPRMTRRFGTSVWDEEPRGVDAARRVDPLDRRAQRERAGRDDGRLERDVLPALDRDRVRVLERPDALDPLDAVRLEESRDAAGELLDDRVLPHVRLREDRASARSTWTPNLAKLSPASVMACAVCTHAFVGMQPTRRHVPPSSGSFSMHTVLAPSCAARIAAL